MLFVKRYCRKKALEVLSDGVKNSDLSLEEKVALCANLPKLLKDIEKRNASKILKWL